MKVPQTLQLMLCARLIRTMNLAHQIVHCIIDITEFLIAIQPEIIMTLFF